MALFLICCCIKLLSPVLEPCIDSTSIWLGRVCPEGCMPACDACCCLNVNSAKVSGSSGSSASNGSSGSSGEV